MDCPPSALVRQKEVETGILIVCLSLISDTANVAKIGAYLSQKELGVLGEALRKAEETGENPSALAILKLLIFTGGRKGEIETLTWPEIDFDAGYLKLADSKTGQKAIPLNAGALQVLNDQKRLKGSDYVFPPIDVMSPTRERLRSGNAFGRWQNSKVSDYMIFDIALPV